MRRRLQRLLRTRWRRAGWRWNGSRAIKELGPPIYGATLGGDALASRMGGYGHSAHNVRVTIVCEGSDGAKVEVETSSDPWPGWDKTRGALYKWWFHYLEPERELTFPIQVRVERWSVDIAVDGRPTPFAVTGTRERWVANGDVDGRSVEILATGCAPEQVGLVSVDTAALPTFHC